MAGTSRISRPLAIRIPLALHAELDQIAEQTKVPKSKLARIAIYDAVRRHHVQLDPKLRQTYT